MLYNFYIKNIDVSKFFYKTIKVAKVSVIIFCIYHNISETTTSVLNRILFACCFRVNTVNTDITWLTFSAQAIVHFHIYLQNKLSIKWYFLHTDLLSSRGQL